MASFLLIHKTKSYFFHKNGISDFINKYKKCHWAILAKMGQKCNFSWSCIFLLYPENQKWFFSQKNHFLFTDHVKQMPLLAKLEFLAHFWQFGSVKFFWPGQKTKSDFFSRKNHFLFTEQRFLVARKIGCSTTPKLLWKILLLRPDVEDFKTCFFEPL